ncbi:sensor histidine kinase [Planococcus sp. CAU13]|uniref:sensor histidine kinase n=1 Tax=Planococcus sp. CAU13 TaxID=1541197 RepID=UPI00052FDD5A|nr:sensor histidine kinase [Planococcus sp. CAU13]
MRSYWNWLSFIGLSWVMAMMHFSGSLAELAPRLIGSAGFFALYFLSPLARKKNRLHFLLFIGLALLAVLVFWPVPGGEPNLYALLVLSLIAGKAVYRLRPLQAGVIGLVLLGGAVLQQISADSTIPLAFLLLYGSMLAAAFTVFRQLSVRAEAAAERSDALLSEYRRIKRRVGDDEKAARQEERTQIARDIHDSVGHKLTALLMQLEVFRLQADREKAEQLTELKELAKESLEETRGAVKTLKHEEAGGVTAIIALIRRLEAESFLRIHFSVKAGALSAPLGNEQMTIVYRTVQEALTNIMRHSGTREAQIVFEAPGGGVFRFAVTNAAPDKKDIHEGFGLTSMRERIEQADGRLEIIQVSGKFTVQGTLPLAVKGESVK